MKKTYRLTTSGPSASMDTDFEVANIVVNNFTGSPVFIRLGAPDIPSELNADILVPAGVSQTYPVSGFTFAAIMSNPSVATGANATLSGLFTTCIVSLLSKDETVPSYGSASAVSLSLSDLTQGPIAFSGGTVSSTFDLAPWGGALVYVSALAGSGQGVVVVSVGSTPAAGSALIAYAIWPNQPIVLNIPRVARYFKLTFSSVNLNGEAGVQGVYSVRGTINEIFETRVSSLFSAPFSKAIAFGGGGFQSVDFVTVGLDNISLAYISSGVGGPNNRIQVSQWESTGVYALLARRDQNINSVTPEALSYYQQIGNPGQYIRVTVSDLGSSGGGGTLYISAYPNSDVASQNRQIFKALGDIGDTQSNNQDIYHELDTIRIQVTAANNNLANINSELANAPNLSYLPTMSSYESNLPTMASYESNLPLIYAKMNGVCSLATGNLNIFPSTWTYTGINMAANGRVQYAHTGAYSSGILSAPLITFLGYGASNGSGVVGSLYQSIMTSISGGGFWGASAQYNSTKDSGIAYGTNSGIYLNQVGMVGSGIVYYEIGYVS